MIPSRLFKQNAKMARSRQLFSLIDLTLDVYLSIWSLVVVPISPVYANSSLYVGKQTKSRNILMGNSLGGHFSPITNSGPRAHTGDINLVAMQVIRSPPQSKVDCRAGHIALVKLLFSYLQRDRRPRLNLSMKRAADFWPFLHSTQTVCQESQ